VSIVVDLSSSSSSQANIIRIEKQLRYFQQYQSRVRRRLGGDGDATARLVRGALVLITLGGNDFINNYYLVPFSARSREMALPDYVRYLVAEYAKILRQLHGLGARRVLVTGSGPLGCAPAELALRGSRAGECDAELQGAAALYNPQLVDMIRGSTPTSATTSSSPSTPTECTWTSSPTRRPTASSPPRWPAAARGPTTAWAAAPPPPASARTGASTPSGTTSTPRRGPTGSLSASL